jgi:hypothetical protein
LVRDGPRFGPSWTIGLLVRAMLALCACFARMFGEDIRELGRCARTNRCWWHSLCRVLAHHVPRLVAGLSAMRFDGTHSRETNKHIALVTIARGGNVGHGCEGPRHGLHLVPQPTPMAGRRRGPYAAHRSDRPPPPRYEGLCSGSSTTTRPGSGAADPL